MTKNVATYVHTCAYHYGLDSTNGENKKNFDDALVDRYHCCTKKMINRAHKIIAHSQKNNEQRLKPG